MASVAGTAEETSDELPGAVVSARLFDRHGPLKSCGDCHFPYPVGLLSPVTGTDGTSPPICGVCALDRVNAAWGTKETGLKGETAEQLRVAAHMWREKWER